MTSLRALWNNQKVKKAIGFLLILVGLVAFFTPFTPGSWLVFVGLELIGLRLLFLDKIKLYFRKHDSRETK